MPALNSVLRCTILMGGPFERRRRDAACLVVQGLAFQGLDFQGLDGIT
ncbi:hypothetical protein [Bradyrhizobium oligotrophicum]|nr:hypothetical protein [Bradyrhizobium oligotrophicum]